MNDKMTPQTLTEETNELQVEELFLLHLRYKEAKTVKVGNNKPILLSNSDTSYVVYTGRVDVFAVQVENGKPVGARSHLFRVEAGQALFGTHPSDSPQTVQFLAVGGYSTQLLQLSTQRLQQLAHDQEFGGQVLQLIDCWVCNLAACLTHALPPKDCTPLKEGQEIIIKKQHYFSAKNGVLWVEHLQGYSWLMGNASLPAINGQGKWPISEQLWFEAVERSKINLVDTASTVQTDPSWQGLTNFQELVLQSISLSFKEIAKADRQRLQETIDTNRTILEDALHQLASPLAPTEEQALTALDSRDSLLQALHLIGLYLGIEIKVPSQLTENNRLQEITRASRVQMRRIVLKDQWWRRDSGPLLATWGEENQPIALLPRSASQYEIYDLVNRKKVAVTNEVATLVNPFAVQIYRPFPVKELSIFDLIRFGFRGLRHELSAIILTGIGVSLLGLFIPVATGIIIDDIIPNADRSQLLQIGFLLFIMALAIAAFQITQNIAVLRLLQKLGTGLQSALWDRVISLPVSFFRAYSAGDLGARAMGFSMIEQMLTGSMLSTLLTGVFSLFSIGLLFYYNGRLAIMALVLAFIPTLVTIFIARKKMIRQRTLAETQGEISGLILQTIAGIAKFRAAGAESRAFATWAKAFSHLKQTAFEVRDATNTLTVFNSGYPVLATIVIFSMVVYSGQSTRMTTGIFLAFVVAFTQFLASMIRLNSTLIDLTGVVPLYERARPILQSLPEVDSLKEDPGELIGKVEASHVSFRYQEDGPLVLNDVSIEANPGEFVALVGSSGSGKSTLFRLLVGFEAPESGSIYYDGHDLRSLDIHQVRRQIGVVLQNGKMMSGDVFNNIIGSSNLTLNDAWEAAAMAGLEDDIKDMPMGMHTLVSDGGGNLSGGQRQRLLIARAIVNKPRILYFDEATSALDNRTQAVVSESLDNLQSTRIVIAHRLSTIMNADRIYVLQNGQIVQQGTYDELLDEGGLFAELAKRQIA